MHLTRFAAALALTGAPLTAVSAQTVQQQFDAATALAGKGTPAEELAAWEALETRVQKNARTLALIRLRKAGPLTKLGRLDEAASVARLGLAKLSTSDPTLHDDRYFGWTTIATAATRGLDYASAADALREARKVVPAHFKVALLLRSTRVETFTDPDAAQRSAAELQVEVGKVKIDDASRGLISTAMSEMYLNLGQFAKARDAARDAVTNLGGMTMKASLADVSARSDAAIALLLLGNAEEARRYLAYTGAGRTAEGEMSRPAQFEPLQCGGDSGVKPEDVAVIELTIDDTGVVSDSTPVYSSRSGEVALAFARSARDWAWTPEQLTDLPKFYRTNARVELRCSTAFERPSIAGFLDARWRDWLEDRKVPVGLADAGAIARDLVEDRSRLAALEAQPDGGGLSAAAIRYRLANNRVVPQDEAYRNAQAAKAIIDRSGAPPLVRLAADVQAAQRASLEGPSAKAYIRWLDTARSTPVYAGDAEARSAIGLMLADHARLRDKRRARALLTTIANDPQLPAEHAFKTGALVRLSSLEQSDGNTQQAQAAFQRSGLDAKQCALLDAPPAMRSISKGGAQFPLEALRWGFEGFTVMQSDIANDGKTRNVRAVMAYPPFVFVKASEGMLATARFTASYRPDGDIGCGGQITPIRFSLP